MDGADVGREITTWQLITFAMVFTVCLRLYQGLAHDILGFPVLKQLVILSACAMAGMTLFLLWLARRDPDMSRPSMPVVALSIVGMAAMIAGATLAFEYVGEHWPTWASTTLLGVAVAAMIVIPWMRRRGRRIEDS